MSTVQSPSYQSARFLKSAQHLGQCPPDIGCEVAFAGRSNAGKSSAMNALTRNRQLARASKTPGRTQLINFFTLNTEECRLVDLPGYGYAKVSREMQERWQRDLHHYLERRKSLSALILLMDVRHPLNPLDSQLCHWCAQRELPTLVLLTKADKLSRNANMKTLQETRKALRKIGPLFDCDLFSATKRTGLDALEQYLDATFSPWLASLAESSPAAGTPADDESSPPGKAD